MRSEDYPDMSVSKLGGDPPVHTAVEQVRKLRPAEALPHYDEPNFVPREGMPL